MKRSFKNPPVRGDAPFPGDPAALLDALPLGVLITDKEGRTLHANLLAHGLPDEAAHAVERILAKVKNSQPALETVELAKPDGRQLNLLISATALRDRRGEFAGAVVAIGDISREREQEREAARRNTQLESLLRHAPMGIALIDENLRYTAFTSVPEPLGQPRQVMNGGKIEDSVKPHHSPEVAAEVIKLHKTVLETGIPAKGTGWRFTRPDGSHYYADWELRRVSDGSKVLGLIGTAVDVTPHIETRNELEKLKDNLEQTVKERTAELARANATVATILETIADGYFATDAAWRVTYFNRTAELLTGIAGSKITGKRLWDTIPATPTFREPLRRVMADRRPEYFETAELHRGKWLEFSVYPSADGGLIVSLRDITARKTTEQELLRLCSLDLVGQMAAGISHEVRNPLTTVKGFLQLLARKPSYAGDKDVLELMISEIDRATGIITQFLSVAKTTPGEAVVADLNAIIANLHPLLESACLEHGKNLVLCTDQAIPTQLVNEKEIRQLLLNLVNNAIEAMQTKGRQVTVGTVRLSRREAALFVRDEGTGIPADITAKIGTPFMTTKDKGTGLGLATCYAIARRNNASVEFTTSPAGTTFSVRFKAGR
ncbi:PAS domain-containing protein [Anaeroselena agilis]|uniref:histidine kinase n=1 Tax=Anaeroselena agilis TaxID=3063788 RepID=A0ABU3NZ22_9FIRM|nr:PAS domain-containing protein [Selenomonadales bacterium 4137-cl]